MIYFQYLSTVCWLRNPELGEGHTIDTGIQWRQAMSGALYSYRKTVAIDKLTLTFNNLTRRKVLEFEAFILNSAGEYIYLRDWRNRLWRGKIVTHPFEWSQVKLGLGQTGERKEDNSILIEFEGELV